jgi:putative flippase GtrA
MKITKTALRYGVVGLLSFLIDFGVTWVTIHFLPLLVANTLGFVIANAANFLIGHKWVFGHHWEKARLFRAYVSVLGISAIGLIISNFVVWGFVVQLASSLLLAKIAATAIAMVWNFLARWVWIYNKPTYQDRT